MEQMIKYVWKKLFHVNVALKIKFILLPPSLSTWELLY
jgi:hypothetical protein